MNTPDNKTKRYSTFAVIFYINKSKRKKNGLCPVMGRISVNAEIAQFSARIDVDSTLWDAKTYRIGKEHAFGYRSEERHPVIPFCRT